jgi:hypothetical protein
MSVRLKLLLAVLIAGAGVSFWFVAHPSTAGTSVVATADLSSKTTKPAACGDTDGDGLCDLEESYWNTDFTDADTDKDGFKDGEEVLSGHDPAKAGPDDYLDEKRNLTQHISALVMGAVTSGMLDKSNPNYTVAVDALAQEVFDQYDANVAVELDSFTISSGSTNDLLAYGIRMASILKPMFAEISANFDALIGTLQDVPLTEVPSMKEKHPAEFKAFTLAAQQEAAAFNGRVDAVKAVVTPKQMEKFQRSLLLYLRGTQQRYRTLATIDRDPLTGLISLQVIRTLAVQTPVDLMVTLQNQLADAINTQ